MTSGFLIGFSGLKNCSNLIGRRLAKLRADKRWTQTELAARCQLLGWDASREMINHIEMQIRLVRDYEVVALAKALNVSPLALLAKSTEALKRLSD